MQPFLWTTFLVHFAMILFINTFIYQSTAKAQQFSIKFNPCQPSIFTRKLIHDCQSSARLFNFTHLHLSILSFFRTFNEPNNKNLPFILQYDTTMNGHRITNRNRRLNGKNARRNGKNAIRNGKTRNPRRNGDRFRNIVDRNLNGNPDNNRRRNPNRNPRRHPNRNPGRNPNRNPRRNPNRNPNRNDRNPDHIPDNNPDHIPDNNPDHIPDNNPDHIPDNNPDHIPDNNPDHIPDNNPDHTPVHNPDHIPDHKPDPNRGRISDGNGNLHNGESISLDKEESNNNSSRNNSILKPPNPTRPLVDDGVKEEKTKNTGENSSGKSTESSHNSSTLMLVIMIGGFVFILIFIGFILIIKKNRSSHEKSIDSPRLTEFSADSSQHRQSTATISQDRVISPYNYQIDLKTIPIVQAVSIEPESGQPMRLDRMSPSAPVLHLDSNGNDDDYISDDEIFSYSQRLDDAPFIYNAIDKFPQQSKVG